MHAKFPIVFYVDSYIATKATSPEVPVGGRQ